MKISSLILLFVVVFLGKSFSQTYNEFINQAYSCAYIENDYSKAASLFEKAFALEEAKSGELYYAAEINFQLSNFDKSKEYLSKSVELGYANYYYLKEQKRYATHFKSKEWKKILKQTHKNYLVFLEDYQAMKESLSGYYKISKKIEGKIDLRNDSLTVKHQGHRNTCSVFAATALIEYLIWDKFNKSVDLSESYNYWAAKTYALTNEYLKDAYTSVDGLAGYLAVEAYKYGSMTEKNWPYENTNWYDDEDERCLIINETPSKECFTGIPPENSKTAKYLAQPVFIDRENIGQFILQEKKPVAMNIFWYFDAIDEAGNFTIPSEKDTDKGGHVILLVGYDSETRIFIFQNSWGTNWGTEGYGTIPEDYIINYYELFEVFPYGIDASNDEKIEYIKGSMGVSANLID
ncbi:MAG: C1 family peptidase [Bacteroidales bacterium]|nr:C1 family peptidase [Bacteroidales bacterium]